MIRSVVFDLGDVLIDWNPRYLYRSCSPAMTRRSSISSTHVITHDWNLDQDGGRTWADAIEVLAPSIPSTGL